MRSQCLSFLSATFSSSAPYTDFFNTLCRLHVEDSIEKCLPNVLLTFQINCCAVWGNKPRHVDGVLYFPSCSGTVCPLLLLQHYMKCSLSSKKIFHFINFKARVTEKIRERQSCFNQWFTLQIAAKAGAGAGWEFRTPSWSPVWVSEAQALRSFSAIFPDT